MKTTLSTGVKILVGKGARGVVSYWVERDGETLLDGHTTDTVKISSVLITAATALGDDWNGDVEKTKDLLRRAGIIKGDHE